MNGKIDYKSSWILIKKVFPILDDCCTLYQLDDKPFLKNEFYEAVEFIKNMNLSKSIQNLLMSKIEQRLRDEVVPEFWSYFKKSENDNKGFQQFYNAVKSLYDCYKQLDHTISKLELFRQATQLDDLVYNENCVHNALKLILKATLLSQLNLDYQLVVMNFYETALKMEDTEEGDGQCIICLQESLHFLEKWLQTVVVDWLRKIYCYDTSYSSNELMVNMFDKKLINYLYNSYTKIRIDQLFNIIIEYPESLPALEDLRLCLPRTDLKPLLTKKLQKAMETRLLHPGVSTPDVLTAYVAAIRSLRVLDPTGLLLETVTRPVHQYLRSREDTVSLTEEGPNDLAEELVRGEAVQVDENTPVDEDNENWETWIPDPIDAAPSKSSTYRRTSDIISMLVNVYGSKELFVNEYRTLLADRLLTQYSCDTEKEIRYLELLKLRFGDSQLHYCEVMLKDIADSKRINQHIKQDPEYTESDISMSAMIVSAQFWPPFKEEKLELHSRLVTQMGTYTSAFETLKGSRTL
ncbi:hypothetical protein NQ314_019336 [Rhamnusium bicolor]|uniref:Cullin family profile domain-containing protein n=1 Tax=Rhamnusium bicolor TaxID=1586634 RepID=A0AAV8WPB6_9CUCU|nr:hypothetical protein NQ314_019336 [Rhamnusium bicolor]